MRQLDAEHDKITKKYKPVSVAVEHIDQSSNLYGPQARFGVHPKHKHFMAFKTHFEARCVVDLEYTYLISLNYFINY